MKVSNATTAGNEAPGNTTTGYRGPSSVRNNSEKKVLHALSTTRWAFMLRPSAINVTSVRWDWSNKSGRELSRLAYQKSNPINPIKSITHQLSTWWLCHRRQNCCGLPAPLLAPPPCECVSMLLKLLQLISGHAEIENTHRCEKKRKEKHTVINSHWSWSFVLDPPEKKKPRLISNISTRTQSRSTNENH